MKIFALAASLREASINRQLVDLAASRLASKGVEVETSHFSEFDVPLYNFDIEEGEGIPEGALRLAEKLRSADGFILATPEYNHSMPGVLKNLIDWTSRIRPDQPFQGRVGLLMSASPAMVGGARGAYQLRQPLTCVGVRLYPSMFLLAQAHQAFDEAGQLANQAISERLDATLEGFSDYVQRLS